MIDFPKMRRMIQQEQRLSWAYEKELSKASKRTAGFSQEGGGGGSYRRGSKVEDGAIMLAAISEQLEEVRGFLKRQREELNIAIACIESPGQRAVLKLRYQEGIGPRAIARGMSYSESYVFQMLREGERRISTWQRDHGKTMNDAMQRP